MTKLYENIKILCKDRKISIRQLENDLNFAKNTISNWNKNLPSCEKVIEVARYFNISMDFLLGYTKDLNQEDENAAISMVVNAMKEYHVSTKTAKILVEIMELLFR